MKAPTTLKEGFEFKLRDENLSFWFFNWYEVWKLAKQVLYVDIHDIEIRVNDV